MSSGIRVGGLYYDVEINPTSISSLRQQIAGIGRGANRTLNAAGGGGGSGGVDNRITELTKKVKILNSSFQRGELSPKKYNKQLGSLQKQLKSLNRSTDLTVKEQLKLNQGLDQSALGTRRAAQTLSDYAGVSERLRNQSAALRDEFESGSKTQEKTVKGFQNIKKEALSQAKAMVKSQGETAKQSKEYRELMLAAGRSSREIEKMQRGVGDLGRTGRLSAKALDRLKSETKSLNGEVKANAITQDKAIEGYKKIQVEALRQAKAMRQAGGENVKQTRVYRELVKTAGDATTALSRMGVETEEYDITTTLATRTIEKMKNGLSGIKSSFSGLLGLNKASDEAGDSLNDLEDDVESLDKELKSSSAIQTRTAKTYKEMEKQSSRQAKAVRGVKKETGEQIRTYNTLIRTTDKTSQSLEKMTRKTRDLEQVTSTTSVALGGMVGSLRGIVASIAGVVSGGALLRMAGDFEQSINRVGALTRATQADFDNLRERAVELGSTTAFSAKEAADGMQFLGMAGFNTAQIYETIPGILKLASASQLDLAETSDIASNIITGFGLEVEDTARLVDVMAAAQTSANVNMQELGETFSYAAGSMSDAGLSIEEASALIGKLGDNGIKASRAGTALRRAMSVIQEPTTKAATRLRELNVSTRDSEGNLRNFIEILDDLAASGADTADMIAIFGQISGPSLSQLLKYGNGELREFADTFKDVEGRADELAASGLKGLNGAFKQLFSAIEGLAIAIGDLGILDFATKIVNGLAGIVRKMIRNVKIYGAVMESIAEITDFVNGYIKVAFTQMAKYFISLGKVIAGTMLQGIGTILAFGETVLKVLSDLTLQDIGEFFREQAENLREFLRGIQENAQTFDLRITVQNALISLDQVRTRLESFVSRFTNLSEIVPDLTFGFDEAAFLARIREVITGLADRALPTIAIEMKISNAIDTFNSIVRQVATWSIALPIQLSIIYDNVRDSLKDIKQRFLDFTLPILETALDIEPALESLRTLTKKIIDFLADSAIRFADAVFGLDIKVNVDAARESLNNALTNLSQRISDFSLTVRLPSLTPNTPETPTSPAGRADMGELEDSIGRLERIRTSLNGITADVQSLSSGILTQSSNFTDNVSNALDSIDISGFVAEFAALPDSTTTVLTAVRDEIKRRLGIVSAIMTASAQTISGNFSGALNTLKITTEDIMTSVSDSITGAIDSASLTVAQVRERITTALEATKKAIVEYNVDNLFGSLGLLVREIIESVEALSDSFILLFSGTLRSDLEGEGLAGKLQEIGRLLLRITPQIVTGLSLAITALAFSLDFLQNVVKTTAQAFGNDTEFWDNFYADNPELIENMVPTLQFWQEVFEGVAPLVDDIWRAFTEEDFWDNFYADNTQFIENTIDVLESLLSVLRGIAGIGESAYNAVKWAFRSADNVNVIDRTIPNPPRPTTLPPIPANQNAVGQELIPEAEALGQELFDTIIEQFENGASDGVLRSAGRRVTASFIAGLSDPQVEAIRELAESSAAFTEVMPQAAKDALGIQSPSTVGMDITGWFIAGLTSPLKSSTRRNSLIGATAQLGEDLLQRMRDTLGIQSPSKEGSAISGFLVDGLVGGLSSNASRFIEAGDKLVADGLAGMNSAAAFSGLALQNLKFELSAIIDATVATVGVMNDFSTATDEELIRPMLEGEEGASRLAGEMDEVGESASGSAAEMRTIGDVLDDVANRMRSLAEEAIVAESLGEDFNLAEEKIKVLRNALTELIVGFGLTADSPEIAALIAQMKALGVAAETALETALELQEFATDRKIAGVEVRVDFVGTTTLQGYKELLNEELAGVESRMEDLARLTGQDRTEGVLLELESLQKRRNSLQGAVDNLDAELADRNARFSDPTDSERRNQRQAKEQQDAIKARRAQRQADQEALEASNRRIEARERLVEEGRREAQQYQAIRGFIGENLSAFEELLESGRERVRIYEEATEAAESEAEAVRSMSLARLQTQTASGVRNGPLNIAIVGGGPGEVMQEQAEYAEFLLNNLRTVALSVRDTFKSVGTSIGNSISESATNVFDAFSTRVDIVAAAQERFNELTTEAPTPINAYIGELEDLIDQFPFLTFWLQRTIDKLREFQEEEANQEAADKVEKAAEKLAEKGKDAFTPSFGGGSTKLRAEMQVILNSLQEGTAAFEEFNATMPNTLQMLGAVGMEVATNNISKGLADVALGLGVIVKEGATAEDIVAGVTSTLRGLEKFLASEELNAKDYFEILYEVSGTVAEVITGIPGIGQAIAAFGRVYSMVIGDFTNGLKQVQAQTEKIQESFELIDVSKILQTETVSRGGILGLLGGTKTQIDEEASKIGLSIAESVESGFMSGMRSAVNAILSGGDVLGALEEGLNEAIAAAAFEAILDAAIVQGVLGGLITELTERFAAGNIEGARETAEKIKAELPALAEALEMALKPFSDGEFSSDNSGGGGSTDTSASTQISRITGDTRDVITELLSPLASLDTLRGTMQTLSGTAMNIYSLLDARLPDLSGGAGSAGLSTASAGSTTVNYNITVNTAEMDAMVIERRVTEATRRIERSRR